MKSRPVHFRCLPYSSFRRNITSTKTSNSAVTDGIYRLSNFLGYRLPLPRPNGPPAINPPHSTLPLSPLVEFPTHYLPYSKRHPKLRPMPGPNQPPTQLSAKLKSNPYARILASPVRNANPFQLRLPGFLLIRLGVLRRPEEDGGGAYMLPTNLLPETRSRQTTMQGIHVSCRLVAFNAMMKKGMWKRLIPDEGSRGTGNVSWRGDMPVYVERGIRRRVLWELGRMVKVLPSKAVVEMDNGDGSLQGADGKELEVGCILVWKSLDELVLSEEEEEEETPLDWNNVNMKGKQRKPRYLHPTGMLRTLSTGNTVPVHDMQAMFPESDLLSENAEEVKELLGLHTDVKEAAIVMHHQTVKAQMWLMKLRFYLV